VLHSRPVGTKHDGSAQIAVLDFRASAAGVGVNEETDTHRERSRNRDFPRMQQGHDVPAVVLGGTRRKGGIEVVGHREEPTDDVVRLQSVRFDQCAQQLIGSRQDLGGIVACNSGGAANSVQSH
jgi:hypothetical protein